MRSLLLAFLVFALMLSVTPLAAQTRRGGRARATDDLARARVLDGEGVKAFGEGRYNDAIRFFQEAHRLGGPAFELWNIAKCHLRLDQPQQAAEMLERYLATKDLAPEDRKEATQQLDELRARESTLTVASSPSGATVIVDGKTVDSGKTPMSTTLPPGPHTVTVELENHAPYTRQVEARYGRAIIVEAPLDGRGDERRPPPPENPYAAPDDRRVALRALAGIVLPRHGGVGGDAGPGLLLSGTYRLADGAASFALGGLFSAARDSWTNTVDAPSRIQGCSATLPGSFSATELSFYLLGTVGVSLASRLRVTGLAGAGAAGYLVPETGGDLFVSSCTSSPGIRPALLVGAQIDYALGSVFRLTAMPISMQVHPAFSGVRETPIDATGAWLRFMLGIGLGVDL